MVDALFPYTRRIPRGEYAVRILACLLVSVPLLWWRWHIVRARQPTEALIFIVLLLVALAIIHAQVMGRLRDMNAPLLISALVFVPYVNAVVALGLLPFPSRAAAQNQSDGALSAQPGGG